jgi:hypothetical protein
MTQHGKSYPVSQSMNGRLIRKMNKKEVEALSHRAEYHGKLAARLVDKACM